MATCLDAAQKWRIGEDNFIRPENIPLINHPLHRYPMDLYPCKIPKATLTIYITQDYRGCLSREYIDRTDQGGTRPSLFHLPAHSDKSRAQARDCHCAERWNNDGRVPPRFVLYLLYIKHDQMIAWYEYK